MKRFLITIKRISTYVVTAENKVDAYRIAQSTHSHSEKISFAPPEQAISIQELKD